MSFDTATLSWVKDEADLALEQAGAALARHAAQPDEAKPLVEARRHLHQAGGALEIAGLIGVSRVITTIEGCLDQLGAGKQENGTAIDAAAGAALVALRRYLDELMAGHPDQPLRLFPVYRALIIARGDPEPAAADLFFPDLSLQPLQHETPSGLPESRLRALRLGFARGLAKWHGGEARGLAEMRNALASVEHGLTTPGQRSLWWVALAWLDVLAGRHAVPGDLSLLAAIEQAFAPSPLSDPPATLMQSLLYDIAVAPPGGEHLERVRTAYRLADLIPPLDAGTEIQRNACHAPLQTAMAEWDDFSRGMPAALSRFCAVARLLVASARNCGDAELAGLAAAIASFADGLLLQPEPAAPETMIEVATALLLAEEAIAQEGARSPVDAALFGAEAGLAAKRLAMLQESGTSSAGMPGSLRHWRTQRIVAQVAREIGINLDAVASAVDDRKLANPLPDLIHQVTGALQLLGADTAAQCATELEADLARAAAGQAVDLAAVADRLATLVDYVATLPHSPPDRSLPDLAPPSTPPVAAKPIVVAAQVDPQLAGIFLEEADELLPQLADGLRRWHAAPERTEEGRTLARLLHTLKGGARLCGALQVGELAHEMESRVEQALAQPRMNKAIFIPLEQALEQIMRQTDALRPSSAHMTQRTSTDTSVTPSSAENSASLRIRIDLIDRLVGTAGEMADTRNQVEGSLKRFKGGVLDLADNIIRLRGQLRELELLAETSMPVQHAGHATSDHNFDPLELDRYTRLQELARLMAESIDDVVAVQHGLLRQAGIAGDALSVQSRQVRSLAQTLLQARMVPFDMIGERLQRLVRQTADELGRQAELEIRGGATPIDRSILDQMSGPLEHLLRNAVAHGIEPPKQRQSRGKPAAGNIILSIAATNNHLVLALADDGAGLDHEAIRRHAIARGLLAADAATDDAQTAALIFQAGFSTARELSEIAGRGIGLDVVRDAVARLGGRIGIDSRPDAGTRFEIVLPLSMALISVILVERSGQRWAIPASMVAETRALDTAWQLHLGDGRTVFDVDSVLGSQEVVVKPPGDQLARVPGLLGATILSDGAVVPIVDPLALARHNVFSVTAVPPAPTFRTPAVMVVDDSLTVRKITGRLLERAGYAVLTAKDGVDALAQLEDTAPAVVLADIEMPRMDGFELVRRLRADPRFGGIPVIMITSRSADKHRRVASDIGVQHYLGKPYDEERLLGLIAGLIRPPPSEPETGEG